MKKRVRRRFLWIDIAVGVCTVVLVGVGLWFGIFQDRGDGTACQEVGTEHQVTVHGDAFSTQRLTLNRCDTIKIVNTGSEDYNFAFGTRDRHETYPGYTMAMVRSNEFIIIDAVQAGTYLFHDHLRDKARIEFDIRQP